LRASTTCRPSLRAPREEHELSSGPIRRAANFFD
jgi:hypothetical protein